MARRLWLRRGRFTIDADVAWTLRRAFATAAGPPPMDGARAAELASRLGLGPRIVTRTPWRELAEACGAEAARGLAVEQAACEARGIQILEVATELRGTGRPIVPLKFAALAASGVVAPGARHASDLDVLVPESAVAAWAGELAARGFAASPVPAYEHHLPAFVHPRRGMVELHVAVPGVRLRRGRFARFEDLADLGLLAAAPGGALIPRPQVLGAHAVAHGWAQHGAAPGSYPMLQWLADLQDLAGCGMPLETIAAAWIARDVPANVLPAAAALLSALGAGRLPESGEARDLLDHLLAAALDADYRAALALRRARPLSERGAVPAGVALLRRTLFPSAAELGGLYGAGGPWMTLRQRVWRPLDVMMRAWRGARAVRRESRRT